MRHHFALFVCAKAEAHRNHAIEKRPTFGDAPLCGALHSSKFLRSWEHLEIYPPLPLHLEALRYPGPRPFFFSIEWLRIVPQLDQVCVVVL